MPTLTYNIDNRVSMLLSITLLSMSVLHLSLDETLTFVIIVMCLNSLLLSILSVICC